MNAVTEPLAPTLDADRVRRHTAPRVQRRIDDATVAHLAEGARAGPPSLDRRLAELDREWDTDRVLEAEAAVTGLALLWASRRADPPLALLPAVVGVALLLHGSTGRYPLMPLFRRLGLRTSREIERERYALKALRGDFAALSGEAGPPVAWPAGLPAADGGTPDTSPATVSATDGRRPSPAEVAEAAAEPDEPWSIGRLPPTSGRVERRTDPAVNRAIRERTDAALLRHEEGDREALEARLAELSREPDVERVLQLNAGTVATAGVLLSSFLGRRFLLLPAAVFGFLAQHALQGWCPPVPVIRRLGVRTVREIERERQALKALRGDYDQLPAPGAAAPARRVRAVLGAVDA